MKKKLRAMALSVPGVIATLVGLVCGPAHATIVDGSFVGTVSSSSGPGLFGLGSETNALAGQTILGSFSYDSAFFATVSTDGATYNQTTVSNFTNTLVITETINGNTIVITNPTNNAQYVNVSQNMATTQYGGNNFVTGVGIASFGEYEQFQLTYAGLNSPTQITSNINDIGAISFSSIEDIINASGNTTYFGTNFSFDITSLQMTSLQMSATPLPTALPLFATGIGAMGLLGWRRKRKAAAIAV